MTDAEAELWIKDMLSNLPDTGVAVRFASTHGDARAALRHALQAIDDRAALVELHNDPPRWAAAVERHAGFAAVAAARRHMRGEP